MLIEAAGCIPTTGGTGIRITRGAGLLFIMVAGFITPDGAGAGLPEPSGALRG